MPGGGYVAAGDARTAEAGARALEAGGNAVDAVVAATLASFVAEPILTGPFGGGFATIAGPSLGDHTYDFFANIPGAGLSGAPTNLDFVGLEVDFGGAFQTFHVGRGASATGWLLHGLLHLQREHGTLSLESVAGPAIRLAKDGVALSPAVARFIEILDPILKHTEASRALFAPRGKLLQAGERFHSPDLADLLGDFSRGQLGGIEAAFLDAFGPPHGLISQEDFAKQGVYRREPLRVDFLGYEILLNPPPSAGGLLIALGLRLMADLPAKVWESETETYMALVAAMATTNGARAEGLDIHLAEQAQDLDALAREFLSDAHLSRWRDRFEQIRRFGFSGEGPYEMNLGGTTHISAIDAEGNVAGITSSNGEGCGHVIPGQGVLANNFMGEEDLHPTGFHTQSPGTRLVSMMCPVVVKRDGRPLMSLGTGGSNRIRTALLQCLVHIIARRRPLDEAVALPRVHFEGEELFWEATGPGKAMPEGVVERLSSAFPSRTRFESPNMFFGGVHAVDNQGNGVGDPRRGGSLIAAGSGRPSA